MASEEQIRIRDIVVAPPEAFGRKFALGAAPGQTYRGEIIAAGVEAGTWVVHWEDDGAYLATEEKYLTLCVRPAPLIEPTSDATPEAEDSPPLSDLAQEPAAPEASPEAEPPAPPQLVDLTDEVPDATRKKRSLEDTSGGASPQAPKPKKLKVDYGEYLLPVACAAGGIVAIGLGIVSSHIAGY